MKKKLSSELVAAQSAARNTDSGPGAPAGVKTEDAPTLRMSEVQQLAAAQPANPLKPLEYGLQNGLDPAAGLPSSSATTLPGASTLSEAEVGEKTGSMAQIGENANIAPLDRVRVDSSGQRLTTNLGVLIADNQNSLKAGIRGPVLMEDFVLREKVTHFDHERIPERIVHARGSAAHGVFECTDAITELTRAAPFQKPGKTTPVFVRFSTVAGERGSKDTARDVRGFAVKFYTDEGNWDLVGNNMPVFFIQDAMKFPDLVHAVKPEPHHGMPQAASAHDTFWDFVSLMPESTHMLMWLMSDRAIPRSYATMQGFGVHTFRLINATGESSFVKFHWLPVAGTHSLVWDEAVKISGADPDFHRRDLWERIEGGNFPQYDLAVQVFTEQQAEAFTFDILDATKLIPEELVPLRVVGRMTLNRNPDNFFAETEQVAYCTANIIPGIDFTNDPLLAGRIHSYVDTQISRLGGPNFHELPINSPVCPVHNNQRDGMHRQAIHRGRVAYEPNSLAGGCPFQAGAQGFMSVAARNDAQDAKEAQVKIRAKPEKFAEHYAQARLFYQSQSAAEKAHIAAAFRFELSKVTVPAIRQRMVASLRNVSETLAQTVATDLGMAELPPAMPLATQALVQPEVETSPALSLLTRPGDGGIAGRKVALLVGPGISGAVVQQLQAQLLAGGAIGRLVGSRIGPVESADGTVFDADASTENSPGILFDALVMPDGLDAAAATDGHVREFVADQYRHCKPMLVAGTATALLAELGIEPAGDPAIVLSEAGSASDIRAFLAQVGAPRNFNRETDPPRV